MLDDLKKKIDALAAFDAEEEVQRIVADNADRITELQQEQLAAGIGRDGRPRIDQYRPLTIYIKQQSGIALGAVTDRVTFFMTGALYTSLKTSVLGPVFQTTSPLETYDKMIDRIGPDNFGLSPDQCFEFATEVTLPEFAKVFERKTTFKL